MAKTAAVKGKALVASLRKNPKVKDPEALAAWIGRKNGSLKGKPGGAGKGPGKSGAKPVGSGKSPKEAKAIVDELAKKYGSEKAIPLGELMKAMGAAQQGDTFTTGTGSYKTKFKVL